MKRLLFFITLLYATQLLPATKRRTIVEIIIKAIKNSMVRSNKGQQESHKISDIKFQQRHIGAHGGFFCEPKSK